MLKKTVPVLALLALLSSCSKDDKTTTVVGKLDNPTDHAIEILFYKGGKVAVTDTVKIAKKSSVEIGRAYIPGENVKSTAFQSKHFGATTDSIVVKFDNTNKVSHYYTETPADPAAKHHKLSSTRNLVNLTGAYTATVKDNVSTALYSFAEADFDFSKP